MWIRSWFPVAPVVLAVLILLATSGLASPSPTQDCPGTAPHEYGISLDATCTVPRAITIPGGGEATFEVRAAGKGATAITITPLSEAIGGVAIPVDVLAGKRRAAR